MAIQQTWPADREAFISLEKALTDSPAHDPSELHASHDDIFRRIGRSLDARRHRNPWAPSSLELAILTQQALRLVALRGAPAAQAVLRVKEGTGRASLSGLPDAIEWRSAGADVTQYDRGILHLRPREWSVDWLGPGDVGAAATARCQRRVEPYVNGDPLLARLKRQSYRSSGQRAAVRSALTTPPGGTLVVCLPTGDGKSLVFQAVASVGIEDDRPGVTVVVVPTRALAEDQAAAAEQALGLEPPLAHIGGRAEANRRIEDRIKRGEQPLCFVSPEAACGSLLPPLREAAQNGRLRALVVDEAHIIDSWGSEFRPEFQTLAGVRRELLELARHAGRPFRTYLLSATLTSQSLRTLRQLFGTNERGEGTPYAVCAAVRLRPEIEYWLGALDRDGWPIDAAEQRRRVNELILRAPRPAILYVTQPDTAEQWIEILKSRGFRRLRSVTGKTTDRQREETVKAWREGDLDLIVGTSAFGLGIDNSNVRTVIHACLPETLDRFYQEVGRGGRDGTASLSFLVPSDEDFELARGMNRPTLITVARGRQRWESMFRHRSALHHRRAGTASDQVTVRLDIAPGSGADDIRMMNETSTQWNARTLNLMAQAGLVSLQAVPPPHSLDDVKAEERHVYQTVRVLEPRHLDASVWWDRVEPVRHLQQRAAETSLAAMREFTRLARRTDHMCIAGKLAELYQVPEEDGGQVALACGGCPGCRSAGREPSVEEAIPPQPSWTSIATPALLGILRGARVVALADPKLLRGEGRALERDDLVQGIGKLIRAGMRNVVLLGDAGLDLDAVMRAAQRPFFVARSAVEKRHLPAGPTLIVCPATCGVRAGEISSPADRLTPTLYVLAEGFEDSERPGTELAATVATRDFDEILAAILVELP